MSIIEKKIIKTVVGLSMKWILIETVKLQLNDIELSSIVIESNILGTYSMI